MKYNITDVATYMAISYVATYIIILFSVNTLQKI